MSGLRSHGEELKFYLKFSGKRFKEAREECDLGFPFFFFFKSLCSHFILNPSYPGDKHPAGRVITSQRMLARRKQQGVLNFSFLSFPASFVWEIMLWNRSSFSLYPRYQNVNLVR